MGDYKLLKFYTSKRELLFKVADDHSESKDLAQQEPALTQQLSRALESYLHAVGAERPEESNSWKKGGYGSTQTLFLSRYSK